MQWVFGGGLALVAGLWLVELAPRWSGAWLSGTVLAVAGCAGLAAGIRMALSI